MRVSKTCKEFNFAISVLDYVINKSFLQNKIAVKLSMIKINKWMCFHLILSSLEWNLFLYKKDFQEVNPKK